MHSDLDLYNELNEAALSMTAMCWLLERVLSPDTRAEADLAPDPPQTIRDGIGFLSMHTREEFVDLWEKVDKVVAREADNEAAA